MNLTCARAASRITRWPSIVAGVGTFSHCNQGSHTKSEKRKTMASQVGFERRTANVKRIANREDEGRIQSKAKTQAKKPKARQQRSANLGDDGVEAGRVHQVRRDHEQAALQKRMQRASESQARSTGMQKELGKLDDKKHDARERMARNESTTRIVRNVD
jgi:hypothetical protein